MNIVLEDKEEAMAVSGEGHSREKGNGGKEPEVELWWEKNG